MASSVQVSAKTRSIVPGGAELRNGPIDADDTYLPAPTGISATLEPGSTGVGHACSVATIKLCCVTHRFASTSGARSARRCKAPTFRLSPAELLVSVGFGSRAGAELYQTPRFDASSQQNERYSNEMPVP